MNRPVELAARCFTQGALALTLTGCKPTPPAAGGVAAPVAGDVAESSSSQSAQAAQAPALPPPASPLKLPVGDGGGSASGPPLTGSPTGLDVERLARSRTTFQLSTDAPMLGGLAALDPATLRASLEADPRWRVSLDGTTGGAIACLRSGNGQDWTARPDGYVEERARADLPTNTLFRACLRFGARGPDHPWETSPMVSHNSPEQRDLTVTAVQLQQEGLAGWQSAALTIDAPGVSVELHEVSATLDLHTTAKVLSDLQQRVASLAMALSRPNPQRAALATLPAGEPALGGPTLRCLQPAEGQLRVRARLNPGAAGWAWARLVADENGAAQIVDEATWARSTAERMGGSSEAGTTWSFDAQLAVGPLPPGARLELWFAPDAGGEPVRLSPPEGLPCTPEAAG